jgi:hypothetical protein
MEVCGQLHASAALHFKQLTNELSQSLSTTVTNKREIKWRCHIHRLEDNRFPNKSPPLSERDVSGLLYDFFFFV